MKRVLAFVACLIALAALPSVNLGAVERAATPRTEQMARLNRTLERLGCGTSAVVAVRLRNKVVVSGWVTDCGPESFVVMNDKTGDEQRVYYSAVDRLAGYNLETGVQVQEHTGIGGKLARALKIALPVQPVQGNSFTKRTTLIIGIVVGIVLAIILAKVL